MSAEIISSLWIGKLTGLERLCIQSFLSRGHSYRLYVYADVGYVPAGVEVMDATEICPADRVFRNNLGTGAGTVAGFSDLFRFKLLLERGGWWCDTDVFCHRRFDFLGDYVFGAEDKPVATGVLKAPAGSKLMRRCFNLASRIDPSTVVWNEYGRILARTVYELKLTGFVLPSETFSPVVWHEIPAYARGEKEYRRSPQSYGVHLYNEMWRRNHISKSGPFSPNSIISILERELESGGVE